MMMMMMTVQNPKTITVKRCFFSLCVCVCVQLRKPLHKGELDHNKENVNKAVGERNVLLLHQFSDQFAGATAIVLIRLFICHLPKSSSSSLQHPFNVDCGCFYSHFNFTHLHIHTTCIYACLATHLPSKNFNTSFSESLSLSISVPVLQHEKTAIAIFFCFFCFYTLPSLLSIEILTPALQTNCSSSDVCVCV